jgi:hypothetical protein
MEQIPSLPIHSFAHHIKGDAFVGFVKNNGDHVFKIMPHGIKG